MEIITFHSGNSLTTVNYNSYIYIKLWFVFIYLLATNAQVHIGFRASILLLPKIPEFTIRCERFFFFKFLLQMKKSPILEWTWYCWVCIRKTCTNYWKLFYPKECINKNILVTLISKKNLMGAKNAVQCLFNIFLLYYELLFEFQYKGLNYKGEGAYFKIHSFIQKLSIEFHRFKVLKNFSEAFRFSWIYYFFNPLDSRGKWSNYDNCPFFLSKQLSVIVFPCCLGESK